MKEVKCNLQGQPLGEEEARPKKARLEPDELHDDTVIHSNMTVKQHAELRRKEDEERRRAEEEKEEEERRRQREVEAAMRIKDSCGYHSLTPEFVDEKELAVSTRWISLNEYLFNGIFYVRTNQPCPTAGCWGRRRWRRGGRRPRASRPRPTSSTRRARWRRRVFVFLLDFLFYP